MGRMKLVVPPPLVAAVAALVQRAVAGPAPTRNPRRTVATVVLSAASLSLAADAGRRFSASGTTVEPFRPEETSVLVTSGPNAITRNPMYVGLAGLLVAHAVWRGSWPALLPVAGFVGYIDLLQIRREERALSEKFGAEYASYRAATPRWLGPASVSAVGRRAG